MKKIYFGLLAATIFSFGCTVNVNTSNGNTANQPANAANTTSSPAAVNSANSAPAITAQTETAISIETFSEFPPEVDGCSCYLSASKSDLDAQKYIYVDNREKDASMKINGEMVKFKRTEEKEVGKDHWVKKFDSKDYEVVVDLTQTGANGPFPQKGTIKLTKKGGQTVTKEVVGECGC